MTDFRKAPGWPLCYDHATGRVHCGPRCSEPVVIWGERYPQCPETMRTAPVWRMVVQLYNQSKISPLAGWPDAYAAWVSFGVVALESAFAERMNRKVEAARNG